MTEQSLTTSFDQQRKRPLEFFVRDMKDEGGISEAEANALGHYSADAIVIIRFLADNDRLTMQLHAQNGATQQELGVEALFSAWLRFTAYIISMPSDEGMKKRQRFLSYVLNLLGLDEKLQLIQPVLEDPGSRDVPADVAAPISDSADPQALC
jgi:hypothetical protein